MSGKNDDCLFVFDPEIIKKVPPEPYLPERDAGKKGIFFLMSASNRSFSFQVSGCRPGTS
jgi:hypothetical protein